MCASNRDQDPAVDREVMRGNREHVAIRQGSAHDRLGPIAARTRKHDGDRSCLRRRARLRLEDAIAIDDQRRGEHLDRELSDDAAIALLVTMHDVTRRGELQIGDDLEADRGKSTLASRSRELAVRSAQHLDVIAGAALWEIEKENSKIRSDLDDLAECDDPTAELFVLAVVRKEADLDQPIGRADSGDRPGLLLAPAHHDGG